MHHHNDKISKFWGKIFCMEIYKKNYVYWHIKYWKFPHCVYFFRYNQANSKVGNKFWFLFPNLLILWINQVFRIIIWRFEFLTNKLFPTIIFPLQFSYHELFTPNKVPNSSFLSSVRPKGPDLQAFKNYIIANLTLSSGLVIWA